MFTCGSLYMKVHVIPNLVLSQRSMSQTVSIVYRPGISHGRARARTHTHTQIKTFHGHRLIQIMQQSHFFQVKTLGLQHIKT